MDVTTSDDTEAPDAPDSILETAKRRCKLAWAAESLQRERERGDLRFQVGEYQWSELAAAQRRGSDSSTGRPMLSIDMLGQPIQLVLNQAHAARLGVNIHPVSEKANDETAEVMQGIYRRIERDSNAQQARLWAFQRAVIAGRGVYRVTTKWDEDADPDTFDQEISIERILHQDMVYLDPAAQKADFSDMEWAFVGTWLPVETFKREFPGTQIPTDKDFEGIGGDAVSWVRHGDNPAVLVVEYIYKKHEMEIVPGRKGQEQRSRDIVTVHSCWLSGTEVLLEEDLNGRYIPLIFVRGRELIPFDGERRWVGMVGPAKDAQRVVNFAASSLIEGMALEPKAPFIGAEGQFEGHESQWQQANTKNFPYMEYRPITLDGKPVGPPQRAQVDGSRMNLAVMALQQAREWVQATTAVHDPSLGREGKDKSGRAILALQSQSDAGTSDLLANLADALAYEARVGLDLVPIVYGRPGRITRILGAESDDTRTVMLNAPFVKDPKTGRPLPAKMAKAGQETLQYNLAEGKYSLSVTIGKSFQTRLQQGGEMLGEILQAHPELVPLIGPTFFRFQDWPGAKEVADILKKVRDQQHPGLAEDDENDAQQTAAKAQQLQMQVQQMGQQLQQATQIIQTKQVEQQAGLQKQQMQEETKRMLAAQEMQIAQGQAQLQVALQKMKAELAITVAQIQAQSRAQDGEATRRQDATAHALDMQREDEENDEQRAHEVAMEAEKHQHSRESAQMGMAHESDEAGQDRAMAQRQAAEQQADGGGE